MLFHLLASAVADVNASSCLRGDFQCAKLFLALLAAALPAISALAESPAEEQMAQRIGSQLKQSGQLHNYEIGVKYHDGVACLEGKVTSPEQRMAAVRLAQKVKGVSRVECKLEIQNESKSSGDEQFKLASATESASPDDSQSESSGAMQAYQQQREPASMPSQQQQMMMAQQCSHEWHAVRSAEQHAAAFATDAQHDACSPG